MHATVGGDVWVQFENWKLKMENGKLKIENRKLKIENGKFMQICLHAKEGGEGSVSAIWKVEHTMK